MAHLREISHVSLVNFNSETCLHARRDGKPPEEGFLKHWRFCRQLELRQVSDYNIIIIHDAIRIAVASVLVVQQVISNRFGIVIDHEVVCSTGVLLVVLQSFSKSAIVANRERTSSARRVSS